MFRSSRPVQLVSIEGTEQDVLVGDPAGGGPAAAAAAGHHLTITAADGAAAPPRTTVGPVSWPLRPGAHTARSGGQGDAPPAFVFGGVEEGNPEVFYCVTMPGASEEELEELSSLLSKFTTAVAPRPKGPGLALPKISVNPEQVAEIIKKGAEDAQSVLRQAGAAAGNAFLAAVDLHKKYAPKPTGAPVEVCPQLREKLAKGKEAAAAAAAKAQEARSGMRAATAEIGSSLVGVGAASIGKEKEGGGGAAEGAAAGGKTPGGLGKELLRDVMSVREAMIEAAGTAWGGLKTATVDIFKYQYGEEAAATALDSCDIVEGLASTSVNMKLTPAAGW